MKMKLMTSLAIALVLIATLSLPAVALTEGSSEASLNILSLISITIEDTSPAGIHFGDVNLGANDIIDKDANSTTPSIIIRNDGSDNVTVQIKGTDFGTGFPVTYASYATSYGGAQTPMSITYTTFKTDLIPGDFVSLWHYLDVPDTGVAAGEYSSTFNYKTITP
jgi:hypothetical protein